MGEGFDIIFQCGVPSLLVVHKELSSSITITHIQIDADHQDTHFHVTKMTMAEQVTQSIYLVAQCWGKTMVKAS
jgi:hypothetical protein